MGYRILVAEDEDDSRTEIERILSKYTSHEILTARDGQQAVELARGTSVDLLITDVRMPRKNGIDALREIVSFTPNLMCIVITGFAGEEAPIQALKLGAKDYINKPINPQELLSSVERLIKVRMLEDEARRLSESLKLFQTKIEEALSIAGATSRVSSHASLDEVLQRVAKLSQDVTGAERVGVWLLEDSELVLQHDSAGADVGATLSLGQGIAGRVAATGQVVCGAGDLAPAPLPAFEQGHRCTVATPLRVRDSVFGVLELFDKNGADFFGKVDLEILGSCGDLAAIAIADNRKDARVNSLLLETLQAAVEPTEEAGQSAVVETIRPAMEDIELGQGLEAGALEVARLIQQIQAHGPDAIAFCGELLSRFHDVLQKRRGPSRSL